ncbi:hypothetical protein OG871_39395 [Kitasatospora sp. NBC_00374]|uniref:hypothetical protein n=1 Tax=Kitasatospora sp. NBC_00374 TaxID=2975964 RepID=UPI0030E26EF7
MSLSTLQTLRITVAALRQVTEETQAQLAAGISLTQDKVSRRQSGASAWTLDDVDALAAHWGLDVLELLAGPTRATEAYIARQSGAGPVSATFAPAAAESEPVRAERPPRPATAAPVAPKAAAAAPKAAPEVVPEAAVDAGVPEPLFVPATYWQQLACGDVITSRFPPMSTVGRCREHGVQEIVGYDQQTPATQLTPAGTTTLSEAVPVPDFDRGPTGEIAQFAPAPCVRCGRPVRHRVAGVATHVGGFCELPTTPVPTQPPAQDPTPKTSVAPAEDAQQAPQPPHAASPPEPTPAPAAEPEQQPAPAPSVSAPAPSAPAAPRARSGGESSESVSLAELLDLIRRPVERELARHGGDVDAATAALIKKAIPDAMALLAASRVGARYEHTDHPPLPDILRKASKASADQVWEARPKWKNTALIKSAESELTVAALDMNGAYLSALKSHLPIGQLKHHTSGEWDPKQAGLYLVTPPAWNHPDLPNPIGNRDEPGPLWLTSSTMRMLQRLAGPKLALCEAPVIHEAWTAYSTENILENFRRALAFARDTAIAENDTVTLEYVKAMYSKFVSTIGLSTANHKMKRPDWMHIIRAQAFANLWWKGMKARDAGLTLVQMTGTDELHLTGDWRTVFPEGRKVTEVKLKDTYTIGGGK